MNYHQTQMNSTDEASYQDGLDLLQYDILYGKRYCYNGTDLYPASDLVMGIDKVDITNVSDSSTGDTVYIYGHNFTNWSKVISTTPRWLRLISQQVCLLSRRKTSVMVMR